MSKLPEGESPRWLDHSSNVARVFYALVAICAVVVIADLTYTKHGHFSFENIPGFHALFGFVAYVGLIMVSKGLRLLVRRPEDYYGENTEHPGQPDPGPGSPADVPPAEAPNPPAPDEAGDA